MKTTEANMDRLALRAIQALVLIMVFFCVTFFLSQTASSSVQKSMTDYEQNAEVLKILHN